MAKNGENRVFQGIHGELIKYAEHSWQLSMPVARSLVFAGDQDEGYFKIFGEIANVTGQARRSEPDQLIAVVIPKKDIKCPEFRVAEVLGVDATCDISGDDRVSDLQYCEIEEIIIDGKPFDFQTDGRGIRKKSGSNGKPSGVYAVSLLSFSEGNPVNFSIKFTPSLGDPRSLIRLDIVDRTNDKEQTDAC